MPIRIKCPKCQTALAVKESLAGKKVSCPKCRNSLAIPAPKVAATKTAPEPDNDIDAEAEALKTFAEETVKPAGPVKYVEFECPYCIEMIKVNAELAGKQAPCPNPECKRILKVPALKEDKPKDWRQINTRIAGGLLKTDQKEPEGAWGTAQTTRVSTEALVEADAIPVKKQPVTMRMWIRRGVMAFVAIAILVGGTWGVITWMASGRAEAALNSALEQARLKTSKPPHTVCIFRGAGQFYSASGKFDEATKQLSAARFAIGSPEADGRIDVARDAAIINLALAWLDFAESQGDKGAAADWSQDVRQVLAKLGSVDAKQAALREFGTRLFRKNQGAKALWLADQLMPSPTAAVADPFAIVEKKSEDEKSKKATPPRSPLAGQQIAFLIANGKDAEAAKIEPPPVAAEKDKEPKEIDLVVRLGYAEGKARKGDFAGARDVARWKGLEEHQFEASVAIADIAIGQGKIPQAKEAILDALKAFNFLQIRQAALPPWVVITLARACARADLMAEAKKVADSFAVENEKEAKALAQLELFLAKLEGNKAVVSASTINEIITAKGTLGYGLALEQAARHNLRLGSRSDALALLEGLSDSEKAFVWIGVAFGSVADNQK